MKNIFIGLLTAIVFLGCSGKENDSQVIEPKLVVQKSVSGFTLNDQNDKAHSITSDTKTLVFAFSKDIGHTCNDFFATKDDSYLNDHQAMFIADVSSAPSVIRSMFIMPGLKDFKHTVLVIDDESISNNYKAGLDVEKIIIVSINNNIISSIKQVSSSEELAKEIEVH